LHLSVSSPTTRARAGNNFYNGARATKLSSLPVAERAEFILMARIEPPLQPALLVRQGAVTRAAAASELGIYGVFIGCVAVVVVSTETLLSFIFFSRSYSISANASHL
jgi:hypothetical protein